MTEVERIAIGLVESVLRQEIGSDRFCDEYMRLWRSLRDSGELSKLNGQTNHAFDRLFTICDSYGGISADMRLGELDDKAFLQEVKSLINDFGYLEPPIDRRP